MSAAAPESAWALLRNRGFAMVLSYRILALLSYQVVAVSVGWHIYQLTGNTFSLGLVGLAEVLPFSAWRRLPGIWSTTCPVVGWAWRPAPPWP